MAYVRLDESDHDETTESGPVERRLADAAARGCERDSAPNTLRATSLAGVCIDGCDGVTVGDVYHNRIVEQTEVIESKCLCLEFQSKMSMRKFRCSVAVFLCWTLVVAAGLTVYGCLVLLPQHRHVLDVGLSEEWYLRQPVWHWRNRTGGEFLRSGIHYVIVGTTDSPTDYCNETLSCVDKVWRRQLSDIRNGLSDIGPNFLVGGNGWVFEGRGANVQSGMLEGWEDRIISIEFIGDYIDTDYPDEMQFQHVNVLLDALVNIGVLKEDFASYGYCQIVPYTISPGPRIMDKMYLLKHWNTDNSEFCLPGLT